MKRKIVYFTNGYQPDREGVSKELFILYTHFNDIFRGQVYLYNLADRWQFRFQKGAISYPDKLLPLGYPFLRYNERTANLAHVYGSLTGRFYLKLIKKRPCILTSASALITTRLEQCAQAWSSLDMIVLESEPDRQTVQNLGVDTGKLTLIYPGVTTHNIQPPPTDSPFTVLFASAPIDKDPQSLSRRGVVLLIEAAKRLQDSRFIFLWRGRHIKMLRRMLTEAGIENVRVIDKIIPGIHNILSGVHATILSPEDRDDCKPCPNSLVESLACGRPVLASNQIGISSLIEREQCGVIFDPDPVEIDNAIRKMQNDYENYMGKALPTASKYFSIDKFINAYENLYKRFGITEDKKEY